MLEESTERISESEERAGAGGAHRHGSAQRRLLARRTVRGVRLPSVASVVLHVVAFVVLVGLFYVVARRTNPGDSDAATLILEGKSIVQGHVTLHGWDMVLDSFWTIDALFFAVGYLFMGIDPHLVFVLPAVIAALLVLVAVRMSGQGRRGVPAVAAVVTVLAMLALPSGVWAFVFLRAGWHVGTVLYCLIAFMAIRRGRWGAGWIVAVAFLAAGLLGDLQTLPLGVGPMFGAGVVMMLRTRSWRRGAPAVTAAVSGVALAYVIRKIAVVIGTYRIGVANPKATHAQEVANAHHLKSWIAQVFGYGNGPLGLQGVPRPFAEVHVVGIVAVFLAVVFAILAMIYGAAMGTGRADDGESAWRLNDMLVLGCVADIAFFVYATISDDWGYLRYLMPTVVFGSILLARLVGGLAARVRPSGVRWAVLALAGATAIAYVPAFSSALHRTVPQFSATALGEFLQDHHLTVGMGSYWLSSITTVETHGQVTVRPVVASANGVIGRYRRQSTEDWYNGQDFQFLVYDSGVAPSDGVTTKNAVKTFGPAAHTYRLGSFLVLVWAHPIHVPG